MPTLAMIVGPIARPLKLGLAAFIIALVGAVFGFVIDYGPSEPLSYVAFGLVAVGVATGFIAVGWGWIAIFRHNWSKKS